MLAGCGGGFVVFVPCDGAVGVQEVVGPVVGLLVQGFVGGGEVHEIAGEEAGD